MPCEKSEKQASVPKKKRTYVARARARRRVQRFPDPVQCSGTMRRTEEQICTSQKWKCVGANFNTRRRMAHDIFGRMSQEHCPEDKESRFSLLETILAQMNHIQFAPLH